VYEPRTKLIKSTPTGGKEKRFTAGDFDVKNSYSLLRDIEGFSNNLNEFATRRRGPRFSKIYTNVEVVHEKYSARGSGDSPMIQAASQANFLEMRKPEITPEEGIAGYEGDPTQGPMCAIEAFPGLLLRSYFFVNDDGTIGQRSDPRKEGRGQINAFSDLYKSTIKIDKSASDCIRPQGFTGDSVSFADFLGNAPVNGYPMPFERGEAAKAKLAELAYAVCTLRLSKNAGAYLELVAKASTVGVMTDTQVVGGSSNTEEIVEQQRFVSQVYGSALPLQYWTKVIGNFDSVPHVDELAKLFLTGQYYGTFLSAAANLGRALKEKPAGEIQNAHRLYLTLLGGGAFKNKPEWIQSSIEEAYHMAMKSLSNAGVSHPKNLLVVIYVQFTRDGSLKGVEDKAALESEEGLMEISIFFQV
jgi:hypothetical protein